MPTGKNWINFWQLTLLNDEINSLKERERCRTVPDYIIGRKANLVTKHHGDMSWCNAATQTVVVYDSGVRAWVHKRKFVSK